MRRRGEAGIVLPAAIAVAIIAVTVVTSPLWLSPVLRDIEDARTNWWRGKVEKAAPGKVEIPFIGPAPPEAGDAHDCVLRVAQGAGLVWTELGWRDPTNHPEPELTGDAAVDRGKVAAWADGMRGYVAQYRDEFRHCSDEKGSPPTKSEPTPAVNYSGTYTLESQGGSCAATPVSVTMSHSPPKGLAANLAFTEGALPGSGEVEEDGHFSVGGSGSGQGGWIPGDYTIELSGQFIPSGDDMLLRSGIFDLNARFPDGQGITCNLSFSGIRQR